MANQNKHIEDLDYLAQLGFEASPATDEEINELRNKIRNNLGGFKDIKNYFYALSIGLCIGITLFFAIYNKTVVYPSVEQTNEPASFISDSKTIQLDTVAVSEKITDTSNFTDKFIETTEPIETINETAENLRSIQTNNLNSTKEISDGQIKITPNASYIFLHDLKIANYHVYYFNAQQNISISGGLPANYSQKNEQTTNSKKLNRNYYLHEAINDAMALFKKQKFADCLILLQTINEYNANDVNCSFYMGMCAFYLKNYNLAYEQLRSTYSNPINVFQEESYYYMALSAMALGQNEEANKMLLDIVNANGFYSQKAKENLKH